MATKQEIRDYFAKFGKEGGKTRAQNMTSEQRIEAARRASQARWRTTEKTLEALESKIAAGKKRSKQKKAKV